MFAVLLEAQSLSYPTIVHLSRSIDTPDPITLTLEQRRGLLENLLVSLSFAHTSSERGCLGVHLPSLSSRTTTLLC